MSGGQTQGQSTPGTQSVPGQTPLTESVPPPPPAHPENVDQLLDRFPDCWFPDWRFADNIPTAGVKPERLVDVIRWLRFESPGKFDLLVDVAGAHWPEREFPFEITYLLHSLATNARVRIKCSVGGENPSIPTITGFWPAANWPEREIYDMFGVTFDGHPDLRRILNPNDWEGHPLRKDFPLGEEPVEFYVPPAAPLITTPVGGDINPEIP